MSANSDPDSWIHKGFQPLHLMEKALEAVDVNTTTDRIVDDYLNTLNSNNND